MSEVKALLMVGSVDRGGDGGGGESYQLGQGGEGTNMQRGIRSRHFSFCVTCFFFSLSLSSSVASG